MEGKGHDKNPFKCFATFIFLYFAVLTPIVTFGGLLGDATDNKMAAIESIFGGAIAGAMYHLFCGQPLTIIGSTGPILVFETIMADYCKEMVNKKNKSQLEPLRAIVFTLENFNKFV